MKREKIRDGEDYGQDQRWRKSEEKRASARQGGKSRNIALFQWFESRPVEAAGAETSALLVLFKNLCAIRPRSPWLEACFE